MAAPTNAAKREKSSCQLGAVQTDMPRAQRNVCFRGQSGKHMLALSFSGFDPHSRISVARRSPSESIDGSIAVAKATSPRSTCVVCRKQHTQRGAFSLGALIKGSN